MVCHQGCVVGWFGVALISYRELIESILRCRFVYFLCTTSVCVSMLLGLAIDAHLILKVSCLRVDETSLAAGPRM